MARLVLNIFYRDVEVQGIEHVPEDGAVVFVGNHVSGLLDPAIFLAYLPRPSRFLGKSTLWAMAVLRPFLRLAAAIPVYRRQDSAADSSKNVRTFDRCHRVLAAGGTIALFPEGRSHNEPALVPLKTGVARIVLQAMDRYPDTIVYIVPVGLTFEDKTRFRSRLLVKVGPRIVPESPVPRGEQEAREAVRALTARVRRGLESVTLNYPSWEEAQLIERAAAIYSRPILDAPAEQRLADQFAAHHLFIGGYERLQELCPEQVLRVADEVRSYDLGLQALRLRDEQVAARYSMATVWRFTLKSLILICFRMPLGILGSIVNLPAYQGTAAVAARLTDSPDVASTYKVFPALVLYPVTWLMWAIAAGWIAAAGDPGIPWTTSWAIGVAVFAIGPISGFFAIRFHQRIDLFLEQARAFLLMRSGRRGTDALKAQRRRLVESVGELAAAYRESSGQPA